VRSITTHHFFTSGNVIFDENIPYNSLHSVPATANDYSSLPFLVQRPAIVPEVPALPPNPTNLEADNLDDENTNLEYFGPSRHSSPSPPPPMTPPPVPRLVVLPSTPRPIRTRSREGLRTRQLTERGVIFEQQIEAEREHLEKVRKAAASRRGGEERNGEVDGEGEGVSNDDKNPFVGGGFENMDSSAMAVSLDAEDYLQQDVDTLSEATLLSIRSNTRRNPCEKGYDMSIPPANYWEAERRTDAEEWKKVTEKELED